MFLELTVRFTGEYEDQAAYTTLNLEIAKTAFLLVDCIYDDPESGVGQVLSQTIAPTLDAVRSVGMKPVFVYGGDHGDPYAINLELHGTRRGRTRKPAPWPLPMPQWFPEIEPQAEDPVIVKCGQNAFRETSLDFYLRTNGIETILCVGFSFKSCLFYTLVGAAEHNYRVVFLRDGTHLPGENEFRDTVNEDLAEKGWVRLVLTRLIEDHLGYSSTCTELIQACQQVSCYDREVIELQS
jgi:nicotinamidase-related amidase